jgi:hypothetical protein
MTIATLTAISTSPERYRIRMDRMIDA